MNTPINEEESSSWMDGYPTENRVTEEVAFAAIKRARSFLEERMPKVRGEVTEAERIHEAECLFVSSTNEYIERRVRLQAELKLAKSTYHEAVEGYLHRPPSAPDLLQLKRTREKRKLRVEAKQRELGEANLEALRQRLLRERAEETEDDKMWRELLAKARSPEMVAARKREEEDYRGMTQLIRKHERHRT